MSTCSLSVFVLLFVAPATGATSNEDNDDGDECDTANFNERYVPFYIHVTDYRRYVSCYYYYYPY